MEIIKTILMVFGVLFLVLFTTAVLMIVKERFEERFDNKVKASLKRLTGETWDRFDNPIKVMDEDNAITIDELQDQIDSLKREGERQHKIFKEEIKKLQEKEAQS